VWLSCSRDRGSCCVSASSREFGRRWRHQNARDRVPAAHVPVWQSGPQKHMQQDEHTTRCTGNLYRYLPTPLPRLVSVLAGCEADAGKAEDRSSSAATSACAPLLPRTISTHPTYACSEAPRPITNTSYPVLLVLGMYDDKGMPWALMHATRTSHSSTRHTRNNGPLCCLRPIAAGQTGHRQDRRPAQRKDGPPSHLAGRLSAGHPALLRP
jgi:hypothetical protein